MFRGGVAADTLRSGTLRGPKAERGLGTWPRTLVK